MNYQNTKRSKMSTPRAVTICRRRFLYGFNWSLFTIVHIIWPGIEYMLENATSYCESYIQIS